MYDARPMADPLVTLLAGSVLVVIGFLAAQLFDRFRLPDYIVLLGIGVVLGSGLLPLGAWDPAPFLLEAQPLLLPVAIAFILFEGGLALHLRGIGTTWGLAAVHTAVGIALCVTGTWAVGVYVLGLGSTASLILGLATCAPSAAIVNSFLPRLNVRDTTRFALTLEGVLGNIVAAALVLTLVRFPGGLPTGNALFMLVVNAVLAFALAAAVGLAWDHVVGAAKPRSFMFMTSVALAILLYAIGEGFLGGNGGLAAFAFGLVLGHWGPATIRNTATTGSRGLQEFHRELVFLLRTFFFIYLGLLIDLSRLSVQALLGAALLTGVFVASRLPTTAVLARIWGLPRTDVRVLRAAVARGLTDTVLVLLAITLGVIPAQEAGPVADLLFTVVILAATVSAVLVAFAERRPQREPAAAPGEPISNAIQRPAPPPASLPLPPPPDDEPHVGPSDPPRSPAQEGSPAFRI